MTSYQGVHQFARGVYGDNGVLKVEIFGNLTGQLKIGGLGPTLAVGRMGAVRGGKETATKNE